MSHIIKHTILGVDGSHNFGLKIGESRAVAVTEVKATEDGFELVYQLQPRPDSEKVFTITGVESTITHSDRRFWRIQIEEVDPANESGAVPQYWAWVPIDLYDAHRARIMRRVPEFARDQFEAAAQEGGPVPAFLRLVSREPMTTSRGPAEKIEWQGVLELGPTPIQLGSTRWLVEA